MNNATSNIKVHINGDKMSAFASVAAADPGYIVSKSDILRALEEKRVTHGLLDAEIDRIAGEQLYGIDVLVAEGRPAVNGRDGRVEYLFTINGEVAPKVLSDGRVDYYDMNIVHPVKKGEPLCRLHAPTPGVAGFNVHGAALAAKDGKPAQLPRGRNTAPNEAGDVLEAAVDGQIKKNGKNVDVVQEFEVKKNVDFSTGNIIFPGSVTVKGNVQSGFMIRSGGDVSIYGIVEKASITAAGDIVLHGGMTGQGAGSLKAGGDIYAKYIENSIITAQGKITAECIMHSAVRAGVGIELLGKKGLLVGGSAKAREYVKAVTIGSQFATLTDIEVGSDPQLNERLKALKAEIAELEAEHTKAAQAMQILSNMQKTGAGLTPQKEQVYERTVKINEEQTKKLAELRHEHDKIENAVKKNTNGFVRASGYIYSGVKISISNYNMLLKEDLQYCTLKSDADSICVLPY